MSRELFWNRMATINAGMLGVAQDHRLTPMSHYADEAANTLWFITNRGTTLAKVVAQGAQTSTYVIAAGHKGLYADLTGTLSVSHDRTKLEELWSVVAASWFDGGIDDPDLCLLAFHLDAGEVWATGTSGAAFLFQIVAAQITGAKPDMGTQFTL